MPWSGLACAHQAGAQSYPSPEDPGWEEPHLALDPSGTLDPFFLLKDSDRGPEGGAKYDKRGSSEGALA